MRKFYQNAIRDAFAKRCDRLIMKTLQCAARARGLGPKEYYDLLGEVIELYTRREQ